VIGEDGAGAHGAAHPARSKPPQSVVLVEALPPNATGQVDKPTLPKQFGDA